MKQEDFDQEFIAAAVRCVIDEVAPEELPVFDHCRERFESSSGSVRQRAFYLDADELEGGIGSGTADLVITLLVFLLVEGVARPIASGVGDAVKELTRDAVKRWLRAKAKDLKSELAQETARLRLSETNRLERLKSYLESLERNQV